MDSSSSSSVTHLVLDHALHVARALGWNVTPADITITFVPAYDPRAARQVNYWDVTVKIRHALNRHRPLTRDARISGVIRVSSDGLLDTLAESDDARHARLAANDNA